MTEPDRLSALFADLREDPAGSFDGPGPDAAEATGRHRRTRRRAVVAAAAAVMLAAGGLAAWGASEPDTLRPIPPAGPSPTVLPTPSNSPPASSSPSGSPGSSPSGRRSSSGSPSPGKITSLRATDWKNAILNLPQWATVCVEKRLRFSGGVATGQNPTYGALRYEILPAGVQPSYGDLTGDGVDEAAVLVRCGLATSESGAAIVVYTENEKGGPRLLGAVTAPQLADLRCRIGPGENGVDVMFVRRTPAGRDGPSDEVWRWQNGRLVKIG
ncbi:hypothetical protein [Cryptosporangium sp. NPDC051539]|uniref:hypothetical protein n=1 Tax=Cryptosporangium sp. NPDC051539 TaxID=3363962 RepID=UPI0037AF6E9D